MNERLDDLRERLESIAEELADLAIDALRRAKAGTTSDDGDDDAVNDAVAEERRLTRARRAVAKAIAVLDDRDREAIDEP